MAAHLITYDLSQPGRNYDKLIAAIKRFPGWCHVTESTWMVSTTSSSAVVRDELKSALDANDKLIAVEVTSSSWASWNLPATVVEWLKKHL